MGDVVDLRQKAPVMNWRCECGCLSFYVRSDDELECSNCYTLVHGIGSWRKPPKFDPDTKPEEADPNDRRVVSMGESGAALRRILKRAESCMPAFVVVAFDDGAVSTFGAKFETEDQLAWLERRLEDARRMMVKEPAK